MQLSVSIRQALVVCVAVALLGLAPAGSAQAETNGSMVAFGDSVPSGARCGCTPFPVLYARKVRSHTGRSVRMTNDAVSGATSATVLREVEHGSERAAVRSSGTVLLMVGANDFVGAFHSVLRHQQRAEPVFREVASRVRANVTETIRVLQELRPGVRVVVAGYWNVVKDGRVGRADYGSWGMRKARQATAWANWAIRESAAARHTSFVSTYDGFKGVHGRQDPTWLLASDGDHPDARGHAEIAEQFFETAPGG